MQSTHRLTELDCSFLYLTYQEWTEIQEPVFFDTIETTNFEFWIDLQKLQCLNSFSIMVVLVRVNQSLYKLTGKQRKTAWESGKISPPNNLNALIFDINETDFLALNREAEQKQLLGLAPNELVKRAYIELNLNFTSERIKHGLISEALNIALRGRQRSLQDKRSIKERQEIDVKKAINVFNKELIFIDSLNPKSEIFVTGVLAGALIMLGMNQPIGEFLERLNNEQGENNAEFDDPIAWLLRSINRYSFKISQKNILKSMSIDLCKKTIQAIDIWLEGPDSNKYWRKRELTGINQMPFIHKLKGLKKISDHRDL